MSWGRSTSGIMATVAAAVALWPDQVEANDRQNGASEDVIRGHRRQVENVVAQVEAFAQRTPESFQVTVSASGHFAASTTAVIADQYNVTLAAALPVAVGAVSSGISS